MNIIYTIIIIQLILYYKIIQTVISEFYTDIVYIY